MSHPEEGQLESTQEEECHYSKHKGVLALSLFIFRLPLTDIPSLRGEWYIFLLLKVTVHAPMCCRSQEATALL